MSLPIELVPFKSDALMNMGVESSGALLAGRTEQDVDDLGDDADKKETMTEKEKRRLEVLLVNEVPGLQVDPSIISRLNAIDRELNMLKGERLKEGSRTRSDSPQEEDVVAICDNGWNEAQNRLDMIEENMTVIQTNERSRLLPLRDVDSQLCSITINDGFLDENDD